MTVATKPDLSLSNSLSDLAARIRTEHEACAEAEKRGLEHAVAAGTMLIEAKAQLKHGQWLPWLRDHCSLNERKAQRYMAIAPHVCKTDILSYLPSPKEITREFAERFAAAPFTELDFIAQNISWLNIKLMYHAGMPKGPMICLGADPPAGYDLLRLLGIDELTEAAIALVPFTPKDWRECEPKPFKIDRATMTDVLEALDQLSVLASILVERLLKEARYRCDHGEGQLRREWHETRAALIASIEASEAESRIEASHRLN